MFVPVVNTDGSAKIQDHYDKTGELLYKRKNMNDESEKAEGLNCGEMEMGVDINRNYACLLYTSPSPRDKRQSRMPSSA